MADKPKPKRRLKPIQTARERTQNNAKTPPKAKRFAKIKAKIAAPFKKTAKFLVKYKAFRAIAKVFKLIGRIVVPVFLRNAWKELTLVTWPTRKESRRLTMAVLAFAIVFGAVIASLDYGLGHLFKLIILGKRG